MPRNDSAFATTTLNALAILATTASTTSTTGAIVCPGGVGIGGNLNVAGTITGGAISYASTSTGTLTVTDGTGTTFNVDSTEGCTGIGTGSAIFDGGVYVAKNLHVGGTVTAGAITYASTSTGTLAVTTSPGNTVVVSSITDSTSVSTGSITSLGGIGAAKKISAGSLTTYDTTQSTSISTGTIITPGGIGAAGNIYAGGTVVAGNATVAGSIVNQGFDLILGNGDQVTRGDSTASRAIVKDVGNVLVINFANDYTGGTKIGGPLQVVGAGTFTTGAFTSVTCSAPSTFAGIIATGTTSVANFTVSGSTSVVNQTVSGTLGVTGNTTLTTVTSGVITTTGIESSGNISTTGTLTNGDYDFKLGNKDTVRGDSGASRALSKDVGNVLVLNYNGDFAGGTRVHTGLQVGGELTAPVITISTTATLPATSTTTLASSGLITASAGISSLAAISTTSLTASGNITAASITSSGAISLTGTTTLSNLSVTGTANFSNAVASAAGTSTFANATIAGALEGGTVRVGGSLALAKSTGVVEMGNSSDETLIRGIVSLNNYDLKIGVGNQVDRGNSGASRALVKEAATLPASKLVINYAGDYTGGVEVQSALSVVGDITGSGNVYALTYRVDGIASLGITYGPTTLYVGNSAYPINIDGTVNIKGNDLRLSKGDTSRGDSGESRALVHGFSNQLIVNFGADFAGGVQVQSQLDVDSNITAANFRTGVVAVTPSVTTSDPNIPGEVVTFSTSGSYARMGNVIDIRISAYITAISGNGAASFRFIRYAIGSPASFIPTVPTQLNYIHCKAIVRDRVPFSADKVWWVNGIYFYGPGVSEVRLYNRDVQSMVPSNLSQDEYNYISDSFGLSPPDQVKYAKIFINLHDTEII